ncbi:MAG: hypothetical protein K2L86_07285 [Lachnospiraceae bacterium]|nr:hypothetical protein [Lachnospiraceae bacterium]
MKSKKKSKCMLAITAIFSVFGCVCFCVMAAYAAASAANDHLVLKGDEKQNEAEGNSKIEYLTEEAADEALNPDAPLKDQHIGRSVRRTKEELSDELREIINVCDTETWYVIESAEYQYIYFGGLPDNYAYQPEIYTDRDCGTVNIFDVDTSIGKTGYVLLEIQQNVSLTLHYNGTQISYTEL